MSDITGRLMALAKNDWLGWESNLAKQVNSILREHEAEIRKDERDRCVDALRNSKTGISTREHAIKAIEANQKKGE